MRMGRVEFAVSVVCDLDDPIQVGRARSELLSLVRKEIEQNTEIRAADLVRQVPDDSLTEADIPNWLSAQTVLPLQS